MGFFCNVSFLDRYITAILYILAGLFVAVDAFILKLEPIAINETVSIPMSSAAVAGIGVVVLLLVVILGLCKGVQSICRVDQDAAIPGTAIARLSLYALAGILVGVATYALNGTALDANLCGIINLAFAIVFGAIILVFAILKYKSIKLVVTDKRVFGRKNIWLTQSFDLPIDKADNIVITFSFWGKMFNYATISIRAVEGEYKVKYVKSAEEFKNLIIDFAENKRV